MVEVAGMEAVRRVECVGERADVVLDIDDEEEIEESMVDETERRGVGVGAAPCAGTVVYAVTITTFRFSAIVDSARRRVRKAV